MPKKLKAKTNIKKGDIVITSSDGKGVQTLSDKPIMRFAIMVTAVRDIKKGEEVDFSISRKTSDLAPIWKDALKEYAKASRHVSAT